MVEQSGEPLLLSFLCYLPHTVQPLGHAFPTQCRVHVRLNDVLSRLCPSLSNLRSRSPSPVRLVQETSHDVPCKTRGQDGFATSFPVGIHLDLESCRGH